MSDSENEDLVLGFSEDLVPPAVIKSAGITEVDFDGLLSPPLKLHEDLKNGCGGQLWPAGMVLSKYMLSKNRETIADKTMYVTANATCSGRVADGDARVELGAGGGLVG